MFPFRAIRPHWTLSVFLTLRKYWGPNAGESLDAGHKHLFDLAEELAAERVVPAVITPLAQAIARSP